MEDDGPITYTINDGKKVVYGYNPNLRELTRKLDELPNKKSLTLSDIYEITLWKLNRYPQINQDIINELNDLQNLKSEEINKTRIKNILKNPKVFPIIDTRALRAAFNYDKAVIEMEKLLASHQKSDHTEQINLYINYIDMLKEIYTGDYHGIKIDKFECLDRFLYDIDKKAKFSLKEIIPSNLDNWKKVIRDYGGKIE